MTFRPAVYSDEHKMVGSVLQTGEQRVASIVVDGVEFKSWLPTSKEDADKINAVAMRLRPPP